MMGILMTGDEVNDAPSLAQADVGSDVGADTDVAAETADIILVNTTPQDIASRSIFGKPRITRCYKTSHGPQVIT